MVQVLRLMVVAVSSGWLIWCCKEFYSFFINDPVWNTFPVLSANLITGLGVWAAGVLALGLVAWRAPSRLAWATAAAIAGLAAVLLSASGSWVFATEALVMLGLVATLAWAGQRLIARITGEPVAPWAGLLVALALVHSGLFVLASAGWFGQLGVGLVVATVALAGLLAGRGPFLDRGVPLPRFGFADAVLAFGLAIAAAAAFMAASLPQSAADPVVHYLPFMRALVQSGGFPDDGMHWVWLIMQPVQLLGASMFAFVGETGAAWLSWLGYLLAVGIAGAGVVRLSGSRTAGLSTALVLATLAPIWALGTSPYIDLMGAAVAVGAVMVLGEAVAGRYRLLPVAGFLIGFAATIKVHMPLFLAVAGLATMLVHLRTTLALIGQWRQIAAAALLFAAAIVPWYLQVYMTTGNPLFPFFGDVFPSSIDYRPNFSEEIWARLTLDYLVMLPWRLTFETANFGGDLNGSVGPVLIAVLVLLPFALARRQAALGFVLPAIACVALATLIMKVGAFRYWLPSILLLATGFGAGGALWARVVGLGRRFGGVCAVAGTAGLLAFLLGYGVRINYFVPDGVGSAVYTGAISREDFVRQRTAGISDFINLNTGPTETVLSSGFYYLNTLRPTSFFFPSLELKYYSKEKFAQFLTDYNVRFWIINPAAAQSGREAEHQLLRKEFLKEEAIVYGNGVYTVYDLKYRGDPPTPLARIRLGDQAGISPASWQWFTRGPIEEGPAVATVDRQLGHSISLPTGRRMVRGVIHLEAAPTATVLVDLIWYDADSRELSRSVLSSNTTTGSSDAGGYDVDVAMTCPDGADRLVVMVRPWRPQDGAVTVRSARLDIL